MKRSTLVVSSLALTIIAGQAWWIASHRAPATVEASAGMKPDATPVERKPLYWYDPMKPEAHFDKPGKSPFMDMDLVPLYADEATDAGGDAGSDASTDAASAAGIIRIDPRMVQNLGVRTSPVTRGSGAAADLRATGSVQIDEDRIVAIESRTAGWIEQLKVKAVGDAIHRGQSVAGLYSPDLYASQQELALAMRMQDQRLVDAARQRLLLQGMTTAQVAAVAVAVAVAGSGGAQRRVSIASPQSGVITELNVREGQQVTPGMPLMRVADLSTVWIVIEVPEAQSAGLHAGQSGEARVHALPGVLLKGTIDYVYPRLDTQARTVRARMQFDNPQLRLKPGMYAEVRLVGDGEHSECLLVSSEAVIRTGGRDVVILALGEGRFRPAVVQLGEDRNGQTEILSGLDEGETVVSSGQFLIDSEASLRGALARMNDAEHQP